MLFKLFSFEKHLNFHRFRFLFTFISILSAFLIFSPADLFGQGDLLITPRRLVFEGSKRSIDLSLANSGQDTATYAISLVQIRMKEDGSFETITEPDPGQRFADPYIRFFPRSVSLGPNEAQVVKVQLTKTNELTDGEYRSHFYFRAVPKPTALGEEDEVIDSSSISVKLTPIFGITIPVIIRKGESTVKITLSELAYHTVNDTIPQLSMTFNRSGNMSVYGDLTVEHISPQGKITKVGIANGIAVYTPNKARHILLSLNKLPGVDYKTGTLRVIYSASSDVKPVRYAEAELALQ
jgi:hypothetical protein